MSGGRGDWVAAGDPHGARARLTRAVRALQRARWRQLAWDRLMIGLLAGLALAVPAVVAARLDMLPWPAWTVTGAILATALAGALLLAWRARPDTLEVAVRADLALNMKQRMSTAWELLRDGADAALVDGLAAQAVRARLPSRSAAVFPLRFGNAARLVPVAAALLALVATLDLGRMAPGPESAVDPLVAGEGARLLEYAQRLEGRARGESLERALEASRQLQRLGNRMRSGALPREQALARLREQSRTLEAGRRAALGEGPRTEVGPLTPRPAQAQPRLPGGRAGSLLQRLDAGRLDGEQARGLGADGDALARLGASAEDLEGAVQAFDRGDAAALRDLLERLSALENGASDARALEEAGEQVARAREGLGEAPAPGSGVAAQPPLAAAAGGAAGAEGDAAAGAAPDGEEAPGDLGGGTSTGGSARAEARPPEPAPDYGASGPLLRPESRPGAGGVFVSQARSLPIAGEQAVAPTEVDARYAAQLEEVMTQEQYPARDRAFIRRYFLSLGADGPAGVPEEPRP